eukprot:CAMPEP_0201513994 /NCGR_PEP_ID=MMETSP0161_2-20130828/5929_1 /ASSEMBLY_ACC=CAM_ASM_000251 /TAXON_ID=180227 /ORGANISM="Neoparamoeba aestuarina, Strain SoJaBio B1-5/56/2" /LENGTH=196 /DNA_ID=CAMNT_0047910403 /DNA_START=24 /DNA_END=610 /DNA_ORIENTATION=+
MRVEAHGFEWKNKGCERAGTQVRVPVIDDKSDVCFSLHPRGEEEGVVVQVKVKYVGKGGEEVLVVETREMGITRERGVAEGKEKEEEKKNKEKEGEREEGVNCGTVGITAVRKAASLASEMKYMEARILLISTQRLLQRVMSDERSQDDYLSFIVQAEKLDQFMREAQRSEEVFGKKLGRDDEASKAMFSMKNVSR